MYDVQQTSEARIGPWMLRLCTMCLDQHPGLKFKSAVYAGSLKLVLPTDQHIERI